MQMVGRQPQRFQLARRSAASMQRASEEAQRRPGVRLGVHAGAAGGASDPGDRGRRGS